MKITFTPLEDAVVRNLEHVRMEIYETVCHELCKYSYMYQDDEAELWQCCEECPLKKVL